MVIAVGITAVVGLSIYLKRKNKSLDTNNRRQFDEPPQGFRSLFAPDEAELRAEENAAQMRVEAERKEAERQSAFERAEKAREYEKIWRAEPTRRNAVELLRLAAESESAEIFSRTAENVVRLLPHEQAGGLSKKDLADLLDSHLRILPQQERLSGATFWLKQEIERLRREAEG